MPCTDPRSLAPLAHRRALVLLPAASALLGACGLMGGKADTAAPAPAPAPQPTTGTTPPAGAGARAAAAPAPATGAKPATAAAKDAPPAAPVRPVAPMPLARNWEDYKRQAARRIVAANPDITHTGVVQQPALAIPVLEIEVAGDGSIVRVDVLRPPREARHTVQIAIDAVRRAGPLPPVAHLPKPWKFTESFLFNDDGRFKPSALNR